MSAAETEQTQTHAGGSTGPTWALVAYVLIGLFFGVVLVKSEVVSWFRIQEMFRFQSFFMYGVLGSAVLTSALVIRLLRGRTAATGAAIDVADKDWGQGARLRYILGGTLFGLGWGLAGTCPGPIYALMGYGASGALVVFVSALAGARVYAALAERLPH